MDRKNIELRDLVEPYLQGKLTPEQEQAFEEGYLADASLLEEVMLAEKLRDGLVRHAKGAPGRASEGARPSRWPSLLTSPIYAAAATVLLAFSLVTSTTLVVQNQTLRGGGPGSLAGPMPTRFLPLVSVRGDASPNVVEVPASDEWLVFQVYAGPEPYDSYRATLARVGGGDPLWQQSGLEPTVDEEILVGLPSGTLEPGYYEIELEGRMPDWADGRFEAITVTPLTVRAPQ
jgi:hypothetical protein